MVTAVSLHILAAIVWIGGMFFAVLVLRPAAGPLEPPPPPSLQETTRVRANAATPKIPREPNALRAELN